jgi:ribosomal protein L29
MAILRMSDAKKLSNTERQTKLADLKMELTKAMNKGSQQKGKRKELKRAISRILTLNTQQGELKKQ